MTVTHEDIDILQNHYKSWIGLALSYLRRIKNGLTCLGDYTWKDNSERLWEQKSKKLGTEQKEKEQ